MRPLLCLSSLILFTDLVATSNRKYLYVLSVAQPRRLICKQYMLYVCRRLDNNYNYVDINMGIFVVIVSECNFFL